MVIKIKYPGLIDTNLLVYAHHQGAPQHQLAREFVTQAIILGQARFTPQICWEFYNVITDGKKVGQPVTPAVAEELLSTYLQLEESFWIWQPTSVAYIRRVIKAAKDLKIRGRQKIFDLNLAATATANGVGVIYTLNLNDFKIFKDIQATNPFELK